MDYLRMGLVTTKTNSVSVEDKGWKPDLVRMQGKRCHHRTSKMFFKNTA